MLFFLLHSMSLKVNRVDALYWTPTDPKLVTDCHKLPVFIELAAQEPHCYGLPAYEYPGMLKVTHRIFQVNSCLNSFRNKLSLQVVVSLTR